MADGWLWLPRIARQMCFNVIFFREEHNIAQKKPLITRNEKGNLHIDIDYRPDADAVGYGRCVDRAVFVHRQTVAGRACTQRLLPRRRGLHDCEDPAPFRICTYSYGQSRHSVAAVALHSVCATYPRDDIRTAAVDTPQRRLVAGSNGRNGNGTSCLIYGLNAQKCKTDG